MVTPGCLEKSAAVSSVAAGGEAAFVVRGDADDDGVLEDISGKEGE